MYNQSNCFSTVTAMLEEFMTQSLYTYIFIYIHTCTMGNPMHDGGSHARWGIPCTMGDPMHDGESHARWGIPCTRNILATRFVAAKY